MSEAPVRLCCFQRHWSIQCPDGRVFCELCYDRFEVDELHVLPDGSRENVCKGCDEAEKAEIARRWQKLDDRSELGAYVGEDGSL